MAESIVEPGIERVQACIANILRSRYVARTPPLEVRHSPGRRSNVENASVTRRSLISNARSPRVK